jgi:hypothetical protein
MTVRFTEDEYDTLVRLAGDPPLADAIRLLALTAADWARGGRPAPDTACALISRELRKAKKAGQTEDATLVETFEMEEPAPQVPVPSTPKVGTFTPVPWDGPTELRVPIIRVS